jgi:hypothetical protein
MASTRNKNCRGDYLQEQLQNTNSASYSAYASFGTPLETHFAGDGLLFGRVAPTQLSGNSCDIESQLFGIGSTNLVEPKAEVVPDIKTLKFLSVIDRIPVFVPEPLIMDEGQRPLRR